MKYTAIFAIVILLACFAINKAKTGFDTIQKAQTERSALLAQIDK